MKTLNDARGGVRRALSGSGVALLVAAAAPQQAAGQVSGGAGGGGFTPLEMIGQVAGMRETLRPDDPAANGRGPFKVYEFEAEAGNRYLATMTSNEFDTFLTIGRTVGGITDVLAWNADGPDGIDAQLAFEPATTGTYLVIAQAEFQEGAGAFELRLEGWPVPEAAEETEVQLGSAVEGALDHRTAAFDGEKYSNAFSFTGAAGQPLEMRAESASFDALLIVTDAATGEEMIRDDDSGGGTDAMARLTLPASGPYTVTVTTYNGLATGSYTLRIDEQRAPESPPARPLELDRAVTSELTASHPTTDEGQYFELWEYAAESGERITVSMTAPGFDALLAIGTMDGGVFTEIATDDDGGGGTNSLLEYEVPAAGRYLVRTASLFPDEVGEFTVRVVRR